MAMLKIRQRVLWAAAAVLSLTCGTARAIEVIPAGTNYDTWVWEQNPTSLFIDDAISTRAQAGGTPNRRFGVVQFNLGTVGTAINSAWLDIAAYDTTAVTLAPAFWVDGNVQPGDLSTMDWSTYTTFLQPFQQQFTALGAGTFAAGVPASDNYITTSAASLADLSALNSVRVSATPVITMIFTATSGRRDWDAIGAGGTHELPFKLVINQQPPVAGDLNGDFQVNGADYTIFTNNWLQTVTSGTNGDFNGDATVSLADFVLFKQYYNTFNSGSGAAIQAIPEPHSLVLLGLGLPAWALLRRRRGTTA